MLEDVKLHTVSKEKNLDTDPAFSIQQTLPLRQPRTHAQTTTKI